MIEVVKHKDNFLPRPRKEIVCHIPKAHSTVVFDYRFQFLGFNYFLDRHLFHIPPRLLQLQREEVVAKPSLVSRSDGLAA